MRQFNKTKTHSYVFIEVPGVKKNTIKGTWVKNLTK
jgi:hypothetical protein